MVKIVRKILFFSIYIIVINNNTKDQKPIDPKETYFVYLKFRQCWKGEEIRQIYLRLFLSANQHDKSGNQPVNSQQLFHKVQRVKLLKISVIFFVSPEHLSFVPQWECLLLSFFIWPQCLVYWSQSAPNKYLEWSQSWCWRWYFSQLEPVDDSEDNTETC